VQTVGQLPEVPSHTRWFEHAGAPGVPSDTGVHVPREPGRLQTSQEPAQALLQQTPSTQTLVWHWLAPLQGCPGGLFGWQVPLRQK
jgi:hypothetical protein